MKSLDETPQGRLPWFTPAGIPTEPYLIGITGGSASGKTSVSCRIINFLNNKSTTLLSMDSFYKSLTSKQIEMAHQQNHNFDEPGAFDMDLIYSTLVDMKKGQRVQVPTYDFSTHSRLAQTQSFYGANIVIFEGIFALYDSRIRDVLDLKIFVDSDDDTRLARRLKRDISERGRDVDGVIEQYEKYVKPAYTAYIKPCMKYADIILPRGLDNHVAIEMIVGHVSRELENRALELRTPLSLLSRLEALEVDILPASTVTDFVASVLKLHGGIGKDVMGLVVQDAGFTSFDDEISKLVPTATIVIDFHSKTHDPILVDCHIHSDIKNMSILIFNTQIASGAAALMAIRVMLDHGALQENIILCALVCSKMGINSVKNAFPKVRLYATKLVDYQLQDGPRIEHGY